VNNNVYVNFDSKEVTFEEVPMNKYTPYFLLISAGILILAKLIFYWCFILTILIIKYVLEYVSLNNSLEGFAIPKWMYIFNSYFYLMPLIIMFVCFTLFYMIKPLRFKYYPKLFSLLVKIAMSINFNFSWLNNYKVYPDYLVENKYVIPYFSNVWLNYELEGDFANQIKSIKITNLLRMKKNKLIPDNCRFMCVFEFKKKPLDGLMKLNYY
jgi:hypothetical protein